MIRSIEMLKRRLKGLMFRRLHGMISCREFEEFILEYIEGGLPQRQRKIFEWHLRICRECRDYLAAYRRSIEIGSAILAEPHDLPPDDVPEDLIAAIIAARKGN